MENSSRKTDSIITMQSTLNDCTENQNQSRKLNFAKTFRPIYYVSRFFGFMPFTIIYDSSGVAQEPKTSAFDIAMVFVSLCAYSYTIIGERIMNNTFTTQNYSNIVSFSWKSSTIHDGLFGIINTIMDLCNRFKYIEILKRFNHFDNEVSF